MKSLITATDNIAGTELTSTRKIRVTRVPPNFASVFCRLFLSLTDISHCMASRLLCQMLPRSPGRNPTENVFNTGLENLRDDAQRVERRSISCIFPWVHYSYPLQLARLEPTRRAEPKSCFKESFLQDIYPPTSSSSTSYELRKQKRFAQSIVTSKTQITFFIRNTCGLPNIWGVFY